MIIKYIYIDYNDQMYISIPSHITCIYIISIKYDGNVFYQCIIISNALGKHRYYFVVINYRITNKSNTMIIYLYFI